MKNSDLIFRADEKAAYKLRQLYRSCGFRQYRMSRFEEYDLYAKTKDFLPGGSIMTFTASNGTLMALKPDVTISIINNYNEQVPGVEKIYYNENVYRTACNESDFREIMQTGLECIGELDFFNICEVITLAARSLYEISRDYILDISHMGIVTGLTDELGLGGEESGEILSCISCKNTDGITELCRRWSLEAGLIEKLRTLIGISGTMKTALKELEGTIVNEKMRAGFEELEEIAKILTLAGYDRNIRFDFSVINNMNYYNGVVFQGFVDGIPQSVLSGGRYDNLMKKLGKSSGAIGFAVYLNMLVLLEGSEQSYDSEAVLLYTASDSTADVLKSVKKLAASGLTVCALKEIPERFKYRFLYKMENGEALCCGKND